MISDSDNQQNVLTFTLMKFCPKHSFLLLLLTATVTISNAQQFGGNPPSIKWKQVNTPAAKVIFPVGLDSMAIKVANIVQQMNGVIQPTIGYKQKQVSIVMQNQTTVANAYVGLAPFRSEFFLTPEQNSFDVGSLPWNEQLAIHEFRHVQQYNNFNVGVSHLLKVLFGEGGQALGNGLAIPDWFFEGDAVFNETHVSEQGRGRLPYFFNGFRSLWAEGKDYSYMKIRNGSYRDYVPDWYPLGYMLVSYGREKYGDDFWKKVTHDAAAFKGGFYPLQRAIKKYSGKDFETFRNDGLNHFKKAFGLYASYGNILPKADTSFAKHHKHFDANREYPAFVNDSTLIYLKSTYDHIPVFVIKSGNIERNISVRDVSIDDYFAYRDGKIIYSAYRPDVRWNYRNYGELVLLDINTGEEQKLTRKTKYFSPAFSDDGKTIVTVEEATSGKSDLHLINTADGKLIAVIPNKQGLFYTYPKFYGADKVISAVRNSKGKMSLAMIDIKTGDAKYLLPFSYQPIAFPVVKNDTVYFTVASGKDDNLYALNITTGKLYCQAGYNHTGSFGFYQPAVSERSFAWVGFAAEGFKVIEAKREDLKWLEKSEICCDLPDFNISALKRDSSTNLLAAIKNEPLPATKYSKSYHLFNFHSIIPNISDPNYEISIAGENVLNTMQTNISFDYNRDEGYKQFGFDAIYGTLFPYISAGANYTVDRRGYYKGSNIYWNETQINAGLQVPLNLSAGKHLTGLQFGSALVYSQTNFQQAYRSMFNDRSYLYSSNFISFSNSTQQARKNIYPMLGQRISLSYKSAVSGLTANQFLASGNFYFPGLFTNQSLVLSAAHQQKNKNSVISFSNDFPFSRGYQAENLYDMNKLGVNYHFPIAYPDAGFANTFYLLRIRGNAFYDYTRATDFFTNGTQFKGTFRSTGAEIYFDTKFFNQASISFGFRYSYLVDPDLFGGNGHNRLELIVPVTIF
ncbi:hypothetical protein SAMN05216524_1011246 [Mucilaginibacter sp. OK098]|nr:hypothetical protein SAMN05216524_1011246 [Mucilaginibacter sp. OK098]